MLKPRAHKFQNAIIERYHHRDSSVEESLIEIYLAGASVSRVETITQTLWGTRLSLATMGNIYRSLSVMIDRWRQRPISSDFPYVYLSRIDLQGNCIEGGSRESVLVAIGAKGGYRKVLGVVRGVQNGRVRWSRLLRNLKMRGLRKVRLFIFDACPELDILLGEIYPQAQRQHCLIHFYLMILGMIPKRQARRTARLLKSIHAAQSRAAALQTSGQVIQALQKMGFARAAGGVAAAIVPTLSYYDFPAAEWPTLRSNRFLEHILRQVKQRSLPLGALPEDNSATLLVAARLRHIAATRWEQRQVDSRAGSVQLTRPFDLETRAPAYC